MNRTLSRGLSLLLAVVMVLSMVPAAVFATDTATTWTKVPFSAITAEDTVAITMSKDGVTYVLPTEEVDTICVRFYETAGRDDVLYLRFAKTPVRVTATDLLGQERGSDAAIDGNTVTVTAKANSIGQLLIAF